MLGARGGARAAPDQALLAAPQGQAAAAIGPCEAAPGVAQALREASHADSRDLQGQEPVGAGSSAELGPAGAAAPAAGAGGGPRCQVCHNALTCGPVFSLVHTRMAWAALAVPHCVGGLSAPPGASDN